MSLVSKIDIQTSQIAQLLYKLINPRRLEIQDLECDNIIREKENIPKFDEVEQWVDI